MQVYHVVKNMVEQSVWNKVFSCEEAALEGQMLVCLIVCQFDFCPQN